MIIYEEIELGHFKIKTKWTKKQISKQISKHFCFPKKIQKVLQHLGKFENERFA